MANFKLVDRETSYLLPPSVDEWLPDEHLARFVVEIVDQLDISALESSYTGSGSDAYHPRMMTALLFYSYATGEFSSRKIEKATYESVPFRYVAANQHPDHDTICTFRKRFLEQLGELFTQILLVAAEMGLAELGDVGHSGRADDLATANSGGKAFYGSRKGTVETVFGIIKQAIGFRQFSLRGLKKVAGEWNLVKCAYNLKRMHALAT